MATTYTSNYNLGKQEDKNDNFSMDVITENMDKLDAALTAKADDLDLTTHTSNTSNPHNVTKTQIGLDNVANMDTTTTSNITDSTDKRFVTDVQRTLLNDTTKTVIGEISATILSTDWTGSTAPYEVDIPLSISGEQITSTIYDIKIIPVWSGTIAQKKSAMEAYSYISEGAITSNNTFTLICYDYKPETELTLNLEVWRKW